MKNSFAYKNMIIPASIVIGLAIWYAVPYVMPVIEENDPTINEISSFDGMVSTVTNDGTVNYPNQRRCAVIRTCAVRKIGRADNSNGGFVNFIGRRNVCTNKRSCLPMGKDTINANDNTTITYPGGNVDPGFNQGGGSMPSNVPANDMYWFPAPAEK